MAAFVIQTIDGQVQHDFAFHLIEAIKFQNWKNAGSHSYELSDSPVSKDFSGYVPVGSIDFIKSFIACYEDIHKIYPINVPDELNSYIFLHRKVETLPWEKIEIKGNTFVKSHETLKGFADIVNNKDVLPHKGLYQVSEVVEIASEWRAFVYNNMLRGLQNYSGDFTLFPNVDAIKHMIKNYKNSPDAYTLDVGVEFHRTFLIEAHNFYSCGLYGFNNPSILPQMFIRSYYHLLKHKK